MVIYIDMDGVIADLNSMVLDIANKTFGTEFKAEDISDYWWGDTGIERRFFENVLIQEGLFRNLKEIEGAVDSINEFKKRGYEIVFLTCPHFENPYCVAEKMDWLKERFNWFNPYDHIIFASDKNKGRVGTINDYLIDDCETNLRNFKGVSIAFKQPWNNNWSGIKFSNWNDLFNYIVELEQSYSTNIF